MTTLFALDDIIAPLLWLFNSAPDLLAQLY
jgi:hypothetical protein